MAEAALVSVATGAINPLISKLTKLLEEESSKLKGVRRNTRFIRDELSTMSATLDILADSEGLNPEMKIWKEHIRELSYDMEDCINDFMFFSEPTGFKGFFQMLKKLKPRHEIAGQIEDVKKHVLETSARRQRYKLDIPPSSHVVIDPRVVAVYEKAANLVGMEGPKNELVNLLADDEKQLKVVSIVGFGGLGKTTLANEVYHRLKSGFECGAFVAVSQKPDIPKLIYSLLSEVGSGVSFHGCDLNILLNKVREYLQHKRYLFFCVLLLVPDFFRKQKECSFLGYSSVFVKNMLLKFE
jgi:thymidylate kinase